MIMVLTTCVGIFNKSMYEDMMLISSIHTMWYDARDKTHLGPAKSII